jgi:hypothetical protein
MFGLCFDIIVELLSLFLVFFGPCFDSHIFLGSIFDVLGFHEEISVHPINPSELFMRCSMMGVIMSSPYLVGSSLAPTG